MTSYLNQLKERISKKSELKISKYFIDKLLSEIIKNIDNIGYLEELNNLLIDYKLLRYYNNIAGELDPQKMEMLSNELVQKEDSNQRRNLIKAILDICRHSNFLVKVYDKNWDDIFYQLIKKANFTFKELFDQRVRKYKDKVLFTTIHDGIVFNQTWSEVHNDIEKYSSSIYQMLSEIEDKESEIIGILSFNNLKMAKLDIACLYSGIVNVMIPANSVSEHIEFILNQTKAQILFCEDDKQLLKIKTIKPSLKYLKKVILLKGSSVEDWVIRFDDFLSLPTYTNLFPEKNVDDLATLMYTSGTTGEPKGIMFSYFNIVYKRFCRALAIPEISDSDKYLSYLPLFHTFGRYLEMCGAIFWGAEYIFMENPSIETLRAEMKMFKPSIFISIPKKWIQLYEVIKSKVNLEIDSDEKIQETVKEVTGGNLKWGLSAAGYLDPEIFMFFQRYGVELMSGFGMTEATGGITMTPPKKYFPNSLGKALPGMKLKLGPDGELFIKSGYLTLGYFGQSKDITFENGWLATGDIMTMDDKGFIEIIDRKKEIYKNIRGETIAPQRIENFFKDFSFIKSVYLVGDHKPHNTLLIYPDYKANDGLLNTFTDKQKKEYFSSVIVTVNNFLASYERILDYRIIDRDFSDEYGELTAKGTFKRKVIEKNFSTIIEEMYKKNYVSLFPEGFEIRIPGWFLREMGSLSRDVYYSDNKIIFPKKEKELDVKIENNLVKIGDYYFEVNANTIDLQLFLTNAYYWLGNYSFQKFTGENILLWNRKNVINENIKLVKVDPFELKEEIKEKFIQIVNAREFSLSGLNYALMLINCKKLEIKELIFEYFSMLLITEEPTIIKPLKYFISKAELFHDKNDLRRIFQITANTYSNPEITSLLRKYLINDEMFLDEDVINSIINRKYSEEFVLGIKNILDEFSLEYVTRKNQIESLFKLLAAYGKKHPVGYEKIRQVLVEYQIISEEKDLRVQAATYRKDLREGFRNWLGLNQQLTIDIETGEEYGWEDVLVYDSNVLEDDKKRILDAISNTAILREAVFLFSKNILLRLNDILPKGIWITLLRDFKDKTAYKVTIQTRIHGTFEIILNLNKTQSKNEVLEEVNWSILAGSRFFVQELIEDFGGYCEDYDLWSAKYVSGNSVDSYFANSKIESDEKYKTRMFYLWPFFIWNASAAYFNFWRLTGYRLVLSNPTPDNFIIPNHDYQFGTKIISFSSRKDFQSLPGLINNFYEKFVKDFEDKYSFLMKDGSWNFIFSGLINAEGKKRGLMILSQYKYELESDKNAKYRELALSKLNYFLKTVEEVGFMPKPLYFASRRFDRWYQLNSDANIQAIALMLNELWDTYRLSTLEKTYPETRLRFYFETIFKNSGIELRKKLKEILDIQSEKLLTDEEKIELYSEVKNEFKLSKIEEFFITRLSYPYLKPTDKAQIIKQKLRGKNIANLVVEAEDSDGNKFVIRNPVSPKEISKLQELFIAENLFVEFKPEHEFLVALSDRNFIIGGLFYQKLDENTLHMEKIVVANHYRRKAVSEKIMKEFFNRAKNMNYRYVTTGFFRPEYFYHFGFKIEKRHSGLVKKI